MVLSALKCILQLNKERKWLKQLFFLKEPREEAFLNTIIFILCMAVWNLKQGKIDVLCLVPTKIDIVDTSILKRFVFPQSISSFQWTNHDIWICYVSLKTWKRHALLLVQLVA